MKCLSHSKFFLEGSIFLVIAGLIAFQVFGDRINWQIETSNFAASKLPVPSTPALGIAKNIVLPSTAAFRLYPQDKLGHQFWIELQEQNQHYGALWNAHSPQHDRILLKAVSPRNQAKALSPGAVFALRPKLIQARFALPERSEDYRYFRADLLAAMSFVQGGAAPMMAGGSGTMIDHSSTSTAFKVHIRPWLTSLVVFPLLIVILGYLLSMHLVVFFKVDATPKWARMIYGFLMVLGLGIGLDWVLLDLKLTGGLIALSRLDPFTQMGMFYLKPQHHWIIAVLMMVWPLMIYLVHTRIRSIPNALLDTAAIDGISARKVVVPLVWRQQRGLLLAAYGLCMLISGLASALQ